MVVDKAEDMQSKVSSAGSSWKPGLAGPAPVEAAGSLEGPGENEQLCYERLMTDFSALFRARSMRYTPCKNRQSGMYSIPCLQVSEGAAYATLSFVRTRDIPKLRNSLGQAFEPNEIEARGPTSRAKLLVADWVTTCLSRETGN